MLSSVFPTTWVSSNSNGNWGARLRLLDEVAPAWKNPELPRPVSAIGGATLLTKTPVPARVGAVRWGGEPAQPNPPVASEATGTS